MTGAELKTYREFLGLPTQWMADHVGVKLRSYLYWESGQKDIPEDVSAAVLDIYKLVNHEAEQLFSRISQSDDQYCLLTRFKTETELWKAHPEWDTLPMTCYSTMLGLLMRELHKQGLSCRLDYENTD